MGREVRWLKVFRLQQAVSDCAGRCKILYVGIRWVGDGMRPVGAVKDCMGVARCTGGEGLSDGRDGRCRRCYWCRQRRVAVRALGRRAGSFPTRRESCGRVRGGDNDWMGIGSRANGDVLGGRRGW